MLEAANATDDLGVGQLILQAREELVLLLGEGGEHADGASHRREEQRGGGRCLDALREAHHERAVPEAVDELARVVLAHGEQPQALLVGGRLRVASDHKDVVVLLGTHEGVVIENLHAGDPVRVVVARDLLDGVVCRLEDVQIDALHEVAHRNEVATHCRVQSNDVCLCLRDGHQLLATSISGSQREDAQLGWKGRVRFHQISAAFANT